MQLFALHLGRILHHVLDIGNPGHIPLPGILTEDIGYLILEKNYLLLLFLSKTTRTLLYALLQHLSSIILRL